MGIYFDNVEAAVLESWDYWRDELGEQAALEMLHTGEFADMTRDGDTGHDNGSYYCDLEKARDTFARWLDEEPGEVSGFVQWLHDQGMTLDNYVSADDCESLDVLARLYYHDAVIERLQYLNPLA